MTSTAITRPPSPALPSIPPGDVTLLATCRQVIARAQDALRQWEETPSKDAQLRAERSVRHDKMDAAVIALADGIPNPSTFAEFATLAEVLNYYNPPEMRDGVRCWDIGGYEPAIRVTRALLGGLLKLSGSNRDHGR